MTFEQARGLFPALERVAYLNAGTFGPLARPVVEAVEREGRRDLEQGRLGSAWFEYALDLRQQLRTRLAHLVGTAVEHVALTASTTDGCNIVLAGLGLAPDDEIVTTDSEHFGLLGPLHTSGARVVVVRPDPDAILAAIGPRTRLLAISQVLWTTGAILPVHELRKRAGIPVLVDGAQSVGAIPVDADGLDFLTISGQKWLCGPDSTGALVVADPERLRIARPSFLSKLENAPDGSFVPRPGAARFDPNWLPAGAIAGLLAALELAPDWHYERAAAMAARCRDLLAGHVETVPGGATLVSFRPPPGEEADATAKRLEGLRVSVRDVPGRGLVRASCGWWTSEDDLERLVAALAASGDRRAESG
jgi:L-cysteine/cystine lyase